MKKDAFYFPHDSNAKDDPKCILLIEQLGLEGHGIYWVLIETLRDQPGYCYPVLLLPAIARRFNTTFEKIKTVVYNYNLFTIKDETIFFSQSLIERMKIIEEKREKQRERVLKRWEKYKQLPPHNEQYNTAVLPDEYNGNTSKVKKSKEEDIKEEIENIDLFTPDEISQLIENYQQQSGIKLEVKPLVSLTYKELKKLSDQYGKEITEKAINKLSLYKESSGKRYKSDYSAILNWVIEAVSQKTVTKTSQKYESVKASLRDCTGTKKSDF